MFPRMKTTLSLLAVLLTVNALPVHAASSDALFEGGAATCVNTPNGEHLDGAGSNDQFAIVAADSGTVTITVVGKRVGIADDGACSFDVAITGGNAIGLDAISPRASVTPASGACTAASHEVCLATATAAWTVSELDTRVVAHASVAPEVPTDVDVGVSVTRLPNYWSPQKPSGALGVDVLYEIGVTGADGVRAVVATGSVRIWDAPAAVTVQGNDIP